MYKLIRRGGFHYHSALADRHSSEKVRPTAATAANQLPSSPVIHCTHEPHSAKQRGDESFCHPYIVCPTRIYPIAAPYPLRLTLECQYFYREL